MRSAILGFCSVARKQARCSAQVSTMKWPSCQAAIEGGRVSYLNHEERKPECWCRAPRASGCVTLPFGSLLRANFLHGLIYEGLQLLRVGIGVAGLDVLYGAMKHAPADGLFDEFREVALLHAPGAEKSTKSEVGLLRDLDVPADRFFHMVTYAARQINTYTSITSIVCQTEGAGTHGSRGRVSARDGRDVRFCRQPAQAINRRARLLPGSAVPPPPAPWSPSSGRWASSSLRRRVLRSRLYRATRRTA